MKLIEQRSKVGAWLIRKVCKLMGGHFGTKHSFYFADPMNPRCPICGEKI